MVFPFFLLEFGVPFRMPVQWPQTARLLFKLVFKGQGFFVKIGPKTLTSSGNLNKNTTKMGVSNKMSEAKKISKIDQFESRLGAHKRAG